MKPAHVLLALSLLTLSQCRNETPRPTPSNRDARAPSTTATANTPSTTNTPSVLPVGATDGGTTTATPPTTSSTPTAVADAGPTETRLQIFKVGNGNCDRTAQTVPLLPGLFGAFTTDRVELEVRGVTYSCDPTPNFDPVLENNTVHLRMLAPAAAARTRCTCRHDLDFHLTGLTRGDYVVVLEQLDRPNTTPRLVSTGRIVASREQAAGTAPPPSPPAPVPPPAPQR